MTYRRLSDSELQTLYKNLKGYFESGEKFPALLKLVHKYFNGACSILVSVDSEYNDSTYDNRAKSVFVYDENDVEIPLNRSDREKFEIDVQAVSIPLQSETYEPLEDIVIYVNKKLPEVYIKEK